MAIGIGKPRKSGKPTSATARKIGILLELVRHRRISLGSCERRYGASERTLLRDLQELRNVGKTAGFDIGARKHPDIFELSEFKSQPAHLRQEQRRLLSHLAELARAFGEPLSDIAENLDDESAETNGVQPFLLVVQPQIADGSAVASVFRELESAWNASARVAFSYKGQLRTVEPAAAIVRSGRYYLVGRDVAKGRDGWRHYALDLITGPIRRSGTFSRNAPPAKYLSTDAIGFFKTDAPPQRVAVTFSRAIAAAALSRKWHDSQRQQENADGTVTISFEVHDLDEIVRWTFGYGDEAWISAPPLAVDRAKAMLARIRELYASR